MTSVSLWILQSVFLLASATEETITANSGDNVTLPCQAPTNLPVPVVEWIRQDLQPDYVYLERDGRSDLTHQHQSFKNRVELIDKQMKDGDISVILEKVTHRDNGTYECHVFNEETNRKKRSTFDTEPIRVINLRVKDLGGGAGLTGDGGNKDGGDKDGGNKDGGDKDGGDKDGEDNNEMHRHVGLVTAVALTVITAVIVSTALLKFRKSFSPSPPDKAAVHQLL